MNAPTTLKRKLSAMMVLALVTMTSSQAFAGQASGTQLGQGLATVFNQVESVMKGEILIGICVISFIGAGFALIFRNGSNVMEGFLKVVMVMAVILGGPALLVQLYTTLGATVAA